MSQNNSTLPTVYAGYRLGVVDLVIAVSGDGINKGVANLIIDAIGGNAGLRDLPERGQLVAFRIEKRSRVCAGRHADVAGLNEGPGRNVHGVLGLKHVLLSH